MEKRGIIIILVIAAVIVLALAVYSTFFYVSKCYDIECFDSNLEKCKRADYEDNAEDAVWMYTIKGRTGEYCNVNVKLLQLKQGTIKLENLEGKEMLCSLDYGEISKPQSDLKSCHGLLKEALQEILINLNYNYVYDNLGKISEELEKPVLK